MFWLQLLFKVFMSLDRRTVLSQNYLALITVGLIIIFFRVQVLKSSIEDF